MKNSIKKLLAVALSLVLVVCVFAACKNNGDGDDTDKVLKIGVVQLVQHVALDAAYEGFVDGLKAAGFSEEEGNIKINYQVASGKADECATIANQLVADGSDLILAIATDAAQAAVNATSSIPIVVTAVTNPEGDCPGSNVTGTSDLGPIANQVALAKEIVPEIETLGVLYNSGEANSTFQAGIAKQAAADAGMQVKEFTVTNESELQAVVESMKGEVEACWIPTDNTCASNMPIISDAAQKAGVATICAEKGMVDTGGLATLGAVDYFELGKQTGKMAAIILNGKAPADMPIQFQDAGETPEIVINEDVAEKYTIPDAVLEKATLIKTEG